MRTALKYTFVSVFFLAGLALYGKPSIMFMYPAGGKQGTSFDAVIGAMDVTSASDVSVSGSGVRVEITGFADLPPARQAAAATRDEAKGMRLANVRVTIDAGAEFGQRDMRLIGMEGASNRYNFYVGEIDEVSEQEPNDTLGKAQSIATLPVCINGQTYEADKDCFKFKLNRGQIIVFDCGARAVKPYIPDAVPGWFQPQFTLYDENGKQAAFVDDYKVSPDPVLIFKVPQSGFYTLEMRDAMFRGRDDFVYRIRVGELPFIGAIFPNGGRLNTETPIILEGVNLPFTKSSVFNKDGMPKIKDYGVKNGKLYSNIVKFDVDENPQQTVVEPDEIPAEGVFTAFPVTINGRIERAGDTDWVRFKAEKGQAIVFETFARRLNSPADTKLTVINPRDKRVMASNDDYEDASFGLITHHADSRIQMRFNYAGDYLLKIEEAEGRGGFDFVYRLKIEEPKPDFKVRITPDNPQIPQGDYAPLKVLVFRTGGFEGDITVEASKLPKGYTAEKCVIEKGKPSGILKLVADADVSMDAFNPEFTAFAVVDGKPAKRTVQASEELMQAFFYTHSVPVDKINISVLPRAPFKVDWGQLPDMPFTLQAGGTHHFEIKVMREEGCKLPVRIVLLRACPGMTIKSVVLPPDQSSVMIDCTVPQNFSGTLEDVLLVMGTAKDGKNTYQSMTPMVMRYRAVGK